MSQLTRFEKIETALPWLPSYIWQRFTRSRSRARPMHLIVGLADHFEPLMAAHTHSAQEQHLKNWCREYPVAVGAWRDDDGRPFRHTYFYPAEQFDATLIDSLAEHCHAGWGEIEIHLHHGVESPDTSENTRQKLLDFRDALAARGCLSRDNGTGSPRYGFVHGNWALANSDEGRFCGVDEEMQILADTGCYADFTLPAPSSAQISKINALYECALPLNRRAPHRRGLDLQCGRPPRVFPLIIQGPLMVDFGRRECESFFPGIECGELSGANPPTLRRLELWREAAITVEGRPDWLFIKLHCHGMAPRDKSAMIGSSIQKFLRELVEERKTRDEFRLHFVTMREMANIVLAACDERRGNPGEYRDYRLQLIQPPSRV